MWEWRGEAVEEVVVVVVVVVAVAAPRLELGGRLHLLDHPHLAADRHELLRVPVHREVSRKWRGGAVTRKFDRHELLRVLRDHRLREADVRRLFAHEGEVELAVACSGRSGA